MRFTHFITVAALAIGQARSQISSCSMGCVDGVFLRSDAFGCGQGDTLCMCGNLAGIQDGIRDCLLQSGCADYDAQLDLAEGSGNDRCVQASAAAGLPSSTTPAPSAEPTTAPVTTSSPPAVTESPSTGPTPAASSSTDAAISSGPVPTESPGSSSSPATESPTMASPSPSPSPTGVDGSANDDDDSNSETGAAGSQEGEDPKGDDAESSGLSVAAKAGIGAGVGVAVVMAAVIAVCLCLRRKQKEKDARRTRALQISQPLPGAGRMYENEPEPKFASKLTDGRDYPASSSFVSPPPPRYAPASRNAPSPPGVRTSYSSELDRNARPYDVMLQGTQPRTMI